MAGMTTRLAGIKNRASIGTTGASAGALLFLLAFAIPQIAKAENKLDGVNALQQSNPATPPKGSTAGNETKRTSEGKTAEKLAAGAITDIKITPEEARLTVAVAMDRPIAPQEFLLENPPRLVLDFPNTENKVAFTQVPVHDASVIRVRVQQYQRVPSLIARMVIDLEDGYGTHQIDTSNNCSPAAFL